MTDKCGTIVFFPGSRGIEKAYAKTHQSQRNTENLVENLVGLVPKQIKNKQTKNSE